MRRENIKSKLQIFELCTKFGKFHKQGTINEHDRDFKERRLPWRSSRRLGVWFAALISVLICLQLHPCLLDGLLEVELEEELFSLRVPLRPHLLLALVYLPRRDLGV